MKTHFLSVTTLKGNFSTLHCDVVRVEACGPYSWIYAGKTKFCCCKHLKVIMKELKPSRYLYRVHRSYIVNMDKIYRHEKKGKSYFLIMTDGARIPVSKRKKTAFLKYYKRRKTAMVAANFTSKDYIGNGNYYPVHDKVLEVLNAFPNYN